MSNAEPRHAMSSESLARVRLVAFDFDGVFTDNTVYVTEDGVESVRCWRSDGLGIARLRANGVQTIIVSTEPNPTVVMRARKLQMPCRHGVADKAQAILEACRELQVAAEDTMFVGNDINDIPAFKSVGFPVAVADAYQVVLPYVVHRTTKAGGYGAVREICDLICDARQANEPIRT